MSTPEEAVYVNGNFSEPLAAQHEFQNKYDLDDPSSAMTSYSRIMHQHTKRQMDTATRPTRQRPGERGVGNLSSLTPESSSLGSVSSAAS